jgi:glycosyltransferase involved in cell wall biosynthesis
MSLGNGSLRLLMVVTRYFPYMGGIETHVYEVSRRLAAYGIQVTVLSTDPSRKLPRQESIQGVNVLRVPAWPAQRDYYFAPELYRTIRAGSWDLMHCQGYHTLAPPLAMLAAWRARLPYVLTFHGGGHSSLLRNAMRRSQIALLRPLLVRTRRLVAVAKFEIEFYGRQLGLSPDHFALIPNGADLPLTPPAEEPVKPTGPLIASVGRLERYKGHQRVLAALPQVLAQCPEARLRIVGSGPYEPTLQQMARELGVAEKVEIGGIPPTDRAGMVSLMQKAALVALLSEYETHPIAILEALALRRPVLVADNSGMRELAERGLARAIPLTSTSDQVAAAMLEQLRQPLIPPMLRLPTWDDCVRDLVKLYHTLLWSARPCAF